MGKREDGGLEMEEEHGGRGWRVVVGGEGVGRTVDERGRKNTEKGDGE